MNLRSIDLNLLVVLQVLLEEQHVTRASRSLSLTQSATSNALDRCRHLFNDPLLERVGGEMRLTAKAQALREPLAAALASISGVVEARAVALAEIRQTVRLVMADQPGVTALTGLLKILGATAPHVDLVLLPWRSSSDALTRLESGDVDLAISIFPELSEKFRSVNLEKQHYVVAMRADHPAAKKFDLNEWLNWPHIVVSGEGSSRGSLEEVLGARGLTRRVAAVVPNFMMVEPLLIASDLIAMTPQSCLSSNGSLIKFEPPLPVADFNIHLAWHARRDTNLVVQHVVELLRKIYQEVP